MTVSYGEHQLDLAAARGDQVMAWRKRRQAELERGEDPQAIMDAVEADPLETLEILWAFIFGANQPGVDVEKVRELMATLIQKTIEHEEKMGEWKWK